MTDPTVQVPVSLIERAERFDRRGGLGSEVHEWLRELRALLSQPTPTAEHKHVCGVPAHNGMCTCEVCGTRWDARPAEPPRIEDMAPGTTFTATLAPTEVAEHRTRRFFVSRNFVYDEWGVDWDASRIDPSTIRDVTPPTQKGTAR